MKARLFALAGVVALGWSLAPSRALAQAEPAPEDYVPPNRRAPRPEEPPRSEKRAEPAPRWNLAISPRLPIRLGDGPPGLRTVGYGGGVRLHGGLLPIGPLRLGAGVQFAYDRFDHDGTAVDQFLSYASFSFLAILDGIFGRARPWLGAGGGFSVAAYHNSMTTPGTSVSETEVVGLVTVAAGVGVRVYESIELGLEGDLQITFSERSAGQPPRTLFQPGLFGLALELGFRF